VPHASVFKGADFALAVGVEEANAMRCGDFMDRAIFISSPSVVIGDVHILEPCVPELRSRHRFALLGYVLMPEHFHLLMAEPQHGNPSKVLQVVKQKVSRSLRGKKTSSESQLELTFASGSAATPVFWQRRFYDFTVWSEKRLKEKLHYMHRNPVDRKLVQHPQDWPWSFYAKGKQGLIRIDELTPKASVEQKPQL